VNLIERLKKAKAKPISIPGTDEKVFIRPLSAREMHEYGKAVEKPDADHVGLLVGMLIQSVQDEEGNAVWKATDADAMRDLPLKTIKFLAEEIGKYSGVEPDSKKN
jgi:hypothetical protein